MLPVAYFERVVGAQRLKTFNANRERRVGLRVDLRLKGYACPLVGMTVADVYDVKVREISLSGGSMLQKQRMKVGQEFLLRIDARDGLRYWLWCKARRCNVLDDLIHLVGMNFVRVLYPGQDIQVGTNPSSLMWLDVEGAVTPDDPHTSENAENADKDAA